MSTPGQPRPGRAPVVVLGEFDGVHVGHRRLLRAAAAVAAREHRPLVAVVLDDREQTARLASIDEVCRRALVAGASATHVLGVDARAERAGLQVVRHIAAHLEPAAVVMACLPAGESGARYPDLRPDLRRHRVELIEVERAYDEAGAPVTSSAIRALVATGDVRGAEALLGAPYTLSGEVVHGSGLGRTIGFPTANVAPPRGRLLPALGVYAATVRLPGGAVERAAVNVGVRPTVEAHGAVLIEAHLLDFDADIYGARIDVQLRHRLRGELRFASVDALIAQMAADVGDARLRLAGG